MSNSFFRPPEGEREHHRYRTELEMRMHHPIRTFNHFITDQITTSLLLVIFAVIAIIWASFEVFGDSYYQFQHFMLTFGVADFSLQMTFKHFVNDFLMALFFFLLGLEIKKEFVGGELGRSKVANVIIFAALGGMLFPATIFLWLSPDEFDLRGWGVPVATDTAFALGVLALLRKKMPSSVFSFVAALAVLDDLGAIVILAFFYTQPPDPFYISLAAAFLVILLFLNLVGVRRYLPYMMIGLIVWGLTYRSGLHATVAGVMVAMTIPARPRSGPRKFMRRVSKLASNLKSQEQEYSTSLLEDEQKQDIIEEVETLAVKTSSPLARLQRKIEPSIFLIVLPLFALLNTGIPISFEQIIKAASHPLSQSIFVALLIGKPLGICLTTSVACKWQLGTLPEGMHFTHVVGVSLLAGIGFTMSIFIAEVGFRGNPELDFAKAGIFSASIIAALLGYLCLWWFSRQKSHTKEDS